MQVAVALPLSCVVDMGLLHCKANLPLRKIFVTVNPWNLENDVATMTGCKSALIWLEPAKVTQQSTRKLLQSRHK